MATPTTPLSRLRPTAVFGKTRGPALSDGTRTRVRGYTIAAVAVLAVGLFRLWFDPLLDERALFLPFVLAVEVTAWSAGPWPARAATLLSVIAATAIGTRGGDLPLEFARDVLPAALFVGVAEVVTLLAVRLAADRERARVSAARTAQLQSVSNAVARGLPAEEVANIVLREGLESLGAGAGVVGVVNEDNETVRVIAASGYEPARIAAYQTFAINAQLPMSDAIRRREPIVVATAADLRARYPTLAASIPDGGSSVILPLLYEDRAIGALYFRFRDERTFDADDHSYFLTLGRECSSALVRARLAEAERAAVARLGFLARAGELLNASLDVDETLARLSELAVPELADWCGVHALDTDGTIRLVEVAHADPKRAQQARAANLTQPSLSDPRGIGAVIRTGEVEHVETIAPEIATRALEDATWGVLAAGVAPRSYAIVPLVARGRTLGSLSLLTDASGRTIGPSERRLAEELAARAAMALDNARLYRELAAREAQRAAIARLGQRAIGLGAPAALPAAAIRELLDTLPDIELAAVLELAAEGLHISTSASRSKARSGGRSDAGRDARLLTISVDDPGVRRALAGEKPVVARVPTRPRRGAVVSGGPMILVPIRTGSAPWGLLVAAMRDEHPPTEDVVSFAGEVASVLGDAFDRARRLEDERRAQEIGRAFIGVVSHELRTPITSIYAGAKLMRRMSTSDEDRAEIAADVEAESDRLYRLTEDLLVLTRLERKDLEVGREPVLVTRLIERVVASEARHWPMIQFDLRLDGLLPTAIGEDNYVEQVLRNLVGNAAKYSPAQSRVEIEARPAVNGGVEVRVLDRGPGVRVDDRDRLFSLFYRAPATASQASGAGIGLFVCEQLVQAMGGRLWGQPRDGGGSEFGFALLPYLDVDEEESSSPRGEVAISS